MLNYLLGEWSFLEMDDGCPSRFPESCFNLETAVEREKAGHAIDVQRKILKLVVTLRVMRGCKKI